MKQRGEGWLAWRTQGIGASDAAAILGISPWKTAFRLWQEKIGEAPPQETTSAMQRGIDLEDEARRTYEAQTGHYVEPTTLEHPDWPVMRASLDGLTFDRTIAVEIKCPNRTDHSLARLGKVPAHYMPQLQHILAVSGAGVCHYFSYHPEEPPALVEVAPDPIFILQLVTEERAFWSFVVERNPPPLTARDTSQRRDTAWVDAALEYIKSETVCAEWKGRRDAAREHLIHLMAQGVARTAGGGVSIAKVMKATVDYARACKAHGLTPGPEFRRESTEWRVTIAKGEKK